ncbi:MAG TPA: hypothetical protein VII66_00340 [Gemmatimonadaceae bacterium]
MRKGAFIVVIAAALSLPACSGDTATGLDQVIYNATYTGQGTIQRSTIQGGALSQTAPMQVTMTLAQLGQDFSGTFSVADNAAQSIYAGSVTGRATSAGADFTVVVPPTCAGTLYGSWTVANGELTGSAAGRDCGAGATGDNVQITFTNLVRQ